MTLVAPPRLRGYERLGLSRPADPEQRTYTPNPCSRLLVCLGSRHELVDLAKLACSLDFLNTKDTFWLRVSACQI